MNKDAEGWKVWKGGERGGKTEAFQKNKTVFVDNTCKCWKPVPENRHISKIADALEKMGKFRSRF